jgi:RNA polymerase sigma-70 factor (ECF subfamily)
MADAVAEAFLDALRPEVRPRFDGDEVGRELRAGWTRGCEVHGDFGLELEPFARHVARRFEDDATVEGLRSLQWGDLVLTWACLQQAPAALRAFDRAFAPVIDQVRRAVGLAQEPAEFRQRVYQRILVSDGEAPPRIAGYRGTGALKAWVRMVASRIAIDDRRRPEPHREDIDEALLGGEADGELAVLRDRYGAWFRTAFRTAVQALDAEDRALLRLRYLHGLSVTEIARMRGVHRVTMSRSLTALRQQVLDAIADGIGRESGVPPAEVASVLRLVHSRLDVSLSAMDY